MNTAQASKMTNIPIYILVRMRERKGTSLLSGPPFHKYMTDTGEAQYTYDRYEIKDWLEKVNCRITAGDAAEILGVVREDVLKYTGVKSFDIRTREYKGKLVINNARNLYLWVPLKGRK